MTGSTVRYGVVGVGLMGQEHIRNLLEMDGTAVTAIADEHPASLAATMKAMEAAREGSTTDLHVFDFADDLFRAEVCDVCIISTPNMSHHDVLSSCFELAPSSLHVLVEKPLCTTISDCRKIVTWSRSRPGLTLCGLEYSYMPPVARVLRDSRAGVIGRPRMVAIREHRFPFLKKVLNWNRRNENTGGTLVEKCCHFFDLFNRILAPSRPSTVYASGSQSVNHLDEPGCDILDNAFVTINYVDSNQQVVSRACLDLCMFAEASHNQEELSVVGDKGKLEAFLPSLDVRTGIRGEDSLAHVRVEKVDDGRIRYVGHHHGSSYLEHLDILELVRAHSRSGTDSAVQFGQTANLEQGLLSVAIGMAAQMSIEENRVVSLSSLVTDAELAAACDGYA
jgi:predicted dehydrogenase